MLTKEMRPHATDYTYMNALLMAISNGEVDGIDPKKVVIAYWQLPNPLLEYKSRRLASQMVCHLIPDMDAFDQMNKEGFSIAGKSTDIATRVIQRAGVTPAFALTYYLILMTPLLFKRYGWW